ncbi:MAG: hypothetical protein QM756_02025 [Polyangiaceae bacterium]
MARKSFDEHDDLLALSQANFGIAVGKNTHQEDNDDLLDLFMLVARANLRLDRFEEADMALKEELNALDRRHLTMSERCALVHELDSTIQRQKGELVVAEREANAALAIRERIVPRDDVAVARALAILAENQLLLAKWDDVLSGARRGVALVAPGSLASDTELARLAAVSGSALLAKKEFAAAQAEFTREVEWLTPHASEPPVSA